MIRQLESRSGLARGNLAVLEDGPHSWRDNLAESVGHKDHYLDPAFGQSHRRG
jgi:hypothetical protein